MDKKVVSIEQSLRFHEEGQAASGGAAGARSRDSTRRILKQMRELVVDPHPNFSCLPTQDDIGFWRVLCEGPAGTPYSGGTWLLYIKMPLDFPLR